jgi:hypothetical protein
MNAMKNIMTYTSFNSRKLEFSFMKELLITIMFKRISSLNIASLKGRINNAGFSELISDAFLMKM